MAQQRLRGRPAHTPGPTFLSYTPSGRKLITVGLNNVIRVFESGSDGEPTNIDDCSDGNAAVVATNDFFIVGAEDGKVCKYSLQSYALEEVLVRFTLPIRDIALSPDGLWAAVASDELLVKVVNTQDMTRVLYIRDLPKPPKHLSFDPSGTNLAISGSDGIVYVYSLSSEQPQLLRKIDGLIRRLETDAEASSKVAWHPDGRAFAAPTATRDIQVMSRSDWERQRAFKSGHTADITALAWSPNGALLATASADRRIVLWDTKTQTVIRRVDGASATVLAMQWHPVGNTLSYTNNDGELYVHDDFIPPEHAHLLEKELQPAPFIHDPLAEISGNARRPLANGVKDGHAMRRARHGTPDSLDEILGDDGASDLDGFIVDDERDNQLNGLGKRTNGHLDANGAPKAKRQAVYAPWQPQIHDSFQSGSTPWRGDRRYLSLNLIGFVWTVDQQTHHTVTVEFYDRELHRDFHFTDPFLYDKACLTESGTLFSCPPSRDQPAMIYYRPHETWTTRADWRTSLPAGESITAMSLSDSYVVVTTSADYVRVFTLFGTPVKVYRQKSTPAVTCASWRDYVLTIGNGPVGGDGVTRLLYTIENVKRDEVCQNEDIVALTEGANLLSVFFSDTGDPCIYDTEGVLLTLLHWRTPSQARWVPLLDTRSLERLASGRKEESYWPVAVAQGKFHCIILKGGDRYPYFPRPLLSEFDFRIPLTSLPAKAAKDSSAKGHQADSEDALDAGKERGRLEEQFVRGGVLLSLLADSLASTHATHAQRAELGRKELEIDKTLLQLLAVECREGEERGMKALELVRLMRDRSGRMVEAAGKVAARFGRDVLGEKIAEIGERRLAGLDEEDEG